MIRTLIQIGIILISLSMLIISIISFFIMEGEKNGRNKELR